MVFDYCWTWDRWTTAILQFCVDLHATAVIGFFHQQGEAEVATVLSHKDDSRLKGFCQLGLLTVTISLMPSFGFSALRITAAVAENTGAA